MGAWDDIKSDFSTGLNAAKGASASDSDSDSCPTCGQSMSSGVSLGGGLKAAKAAGQGAKKKMASSFFDDL